MSGLAHTASSTILISIWCWKFLWLMENGPLILYNFSPCFVNQYGVTHCWFCTFLQHFFSLSFVHNVYLSISPWISTWSNKCGCIIEYLLHLVLLFVKKCVCSIWPDILLIAWLIMATCKLCCKKVLTNAKTVACAICHWKYHLNCISINENELTAILSAPNHWYCMFCMCSSLPFIHIKDELEYEEILSERNKFDLTCESFQEKLFNPFSPKDKELDLAWNLASWFYLWHV